MNDPLKIAGGKVSTFNAPLKTPFITALGRKTQTTNVGIHIKLRNGIAGYGEASGSVVMAHLTPDRLASALHLELDRAVGKDIRRHTQIIGIVWNRNRRIPPAAAAFECAVMDALTRTYKTPMAEWFGGAQTELRTDITLSAADIPATREASRQAAREGFTQLKIKVGTGTDDLPRVMAAWDECRQMRSRTKIILDGNQRMTAAGSLRLVDACLKKKVPVVLLEQPVPASDIKGLASIARRCSVPVAADESVRSAEDAIKVLDADAADVLNVKIAKTGLEESLTIIALAISAGKKLMIGCMQETAAGLSASVHLACGTGAFDFVDLDSDHLLSIRQPAGTFTRRGPEVSIASRGGSPGRR